MKQIDNRIDYLISLGFDYNLKSGHSWLISYLDNYHDIEDENYPLWLMIREMGNRTIVDNELQRFSANVSTIVYEDFFFNNKLSGVLAELEHITNGVISYKVLDEFDPLYNHDGTIANNEFWDRIHQPDGVSSYSCRYEICGRSCEFDYPFYDPRPTYLNPEFITELCATLDDLIFDNNVNYFSEEFITFFQLPQKAQEILSEDHGVSLNKDLIKKFRRTDFEKKRDKLRQEKEKRAEERRRLFLSGKVNTRFATKEELARLEAYKKKKKTELVQVIVFAALLSGLVAWGLTVDMLKIRPFQASFWILLIAILCFVTFVAKESKIGLINKDLKEREVERCRGVISTVHKGKDRTVVRFNKGSTPKSFLVYSEYKDLEEGNEIIFDVFYKSKVFADLVEVRLRKSY